MNKTATQERRGGFVGLFAILIMAAAAACFTSGCAAYGDPLKLGAGESKAKFSTAANKTTTTIDPETDTPVTTSEPVDGDVILYEGDLVNDNFQHHDIQGFRAPEDTFCAAFQTWMLSRPGGGPLTDSEAKLAENFLGTMKDGMKQQNLRSREIIATRIVDSAPAAATALARTAATQATIDRAFDTADLALNPAAMVGQAIDKGVEYQKAREAAAKAASVPAPTATPTPTPTPTGSTQ
jgi:hypothetical protein